MVYTYTLNKSQMFNTPELKGISFENEWICIDNGFTIIKENYSWNGCSPTFKLFGKVMGTWEGKKDKDGKPTTYYASLIHDALYQFMDDLRPQGLTRKIADKIFYKEMKNAGFSLSALYWFGVRTFGWIFV